MKKIIYVVFIFCIPFSIHAESICTSLNNQNIRYGARDIQTSNEITKLQKFLQSNNYLSANPTGFFGSATLSAVKKFQKTHALNPTGFVGSLTRAKIKYLSCSANGSSQIINSNISQSSSSSVVEDNFSVVYPTGGETFIQWSDQIPVAIANPRYNGTYNFSIVDKNGTRLLFLGNKDVTYATDLFKTSMPLGYLSGEIGKNYPSVRLQVVAKGSGVTRYSNPFSVKYPTPIITEITYKNIDKNIIYSGEKILIHGLNFEGVSKAYVESNNGYVYELDTVLLSSGEIEISGRNDISTGDYTFYVIRSGTNGIMSNKLQIKYKNIDK